MALYTKNKDSISAKILNKFKSMEVGQKVHRDDLIREFYELDETYEPDFFQRRSFDALKSTVFRYTNIKTRTKNGYIELLQK